MLYMVIETFRNGGAAPLYARFRAKGRMLPEGLEYIDSWVAEDMTRCFQLMRTEDPALFEAWCTEWDDLTDFEIVPVTTSAEAAEAERRR